MADLPERIAHLLPLLDARHSGRPEHGDQPADRLSAQLVSEAARTARRSSANTSARARGAAFQNQHALEMAADADEAITEAEGGAVRYCYVTPKVVITEDDAEIADENAQLVFKVCQNMGFDPRESKTINAVEA